jgi:drug/metabolite transporter (DMT)-like permease
MGSIVPVAWGLLTGERPGPLVLVGVLGAMVAAALVAREPDAAAVAGRSMGWSVTVGLVAGAFLGSSLVCFAHTHAESGLWAVLAARVVAATVAGLSLVAARGSIRLPNRSRWLAVGAGAFDLGGTTLVVVGLRRALASVIGPIASLAPGFTVLWAVVVLREPIARVQAVGLALALVSLVLIAAG